MSNLPLQPLVWDWSYGDGGKTNAVCRAKSPSHEYIIRLEAGGDCYVDYRKFDNDEDSDNRKDEPPVFDSIKAAQEWVQSTHYPSKMHPYVKPMPTWIYASDQLPVSDSSYLCAIVDKGFINYRIMMFWTVVDKFAFDHEKVLAWMRLPEPPISKESDCD